jgi:Spondin_N
MKNALRGSLPLFLAAATIGTLSPHHSHAQDESAQLLADGSSARRVRISFENLTASQPFSPPTFVVHNAAVPPLFAEGQPASFALQRLAEEGNNGPLITGLAPSLGGAVGWALSSLSTFPGQRKSLVVTVTSGYPLVSGLFMLVRTNDGFSGIQNVNAHELTSPWTADVYAWDAGTENNNEQADYLVAMEGSARDPEGGTIQRHTGLRGDADAPGFWKFDPARPVARITITPIP